ncbi:MAG: hypothetical protein LQ351_006907 [Letrouitia transgressa]|nr:MAG: hypothetical protein LQ351_006907 [Letrouitia transgressa]
MTHQLSREIAFVLSNLPASLTRLFIGDLTDAPADLLESVLPSLSPNLEYLQLNALITQAFLSGLSKLWEPPLKNLFHLHIIDFTGVFTDSELGHDIPANLMRNFTLFHVVFGYIWDVVFDGFLRKLRKVVVSASSLREQLCQYCGEMTGLRNILKALARKDGENAVLSEDESGVYFDIIPDRP